MSTDPNSFSNDVRASMLRATQNNHNDNSYLTMDWIQSNFLINNKKLINSLKIDTNKNPYLKAILSVAEYILTGMH